MLEHGGRLILAAREYGIPPEHWLDLSTGINPDGWPLPEIPASAWRRLPEAEDGLEAAACAYHGVPHCLPVAGTQAAIQALPRLRAPGRVGMLVPAYAEHAEAWRRAGHEVIEIRHSRAGGNPAEGQSGPWIDELDARLRGHDGNGLDVLLLIHPNNPTGARFPIETLLAWQAALAARGGWLIVDEAFMDATPEFSLAAYTDRPGLIVLRSLGKFFGLAGARVGFVLAEEALLRRLNDKLGPWTVSGPSRHIAALALADRAWQAATREALRAAGARLATLLSGHGLTPSGGCGLFQWVETPAAEAIHRQLAQRGILTRLFDAPPSLRFGLPPDEAGWARLATALGEAAK